MARITLILTVLTTIIALLGGFKLLMNELRDLRDHKRLTGRWFVLALWLCAPDLADAACTGASPTWTSTPDNASISSCVSSAARGDTINVTAGSGTAAWTAAVTLTKGVSLIGPGRDALEVSRSATLLTIDPDATAITNSENIKVTGFTFNANNSGAVILDMIGAGALGTKPYRNVIIGDNRLKNSTQEGIHGRGQIRGVIYNNIFDRTNMLIRPWGNDDYREQQNGNYPSALGTADNLYFEDNVITCSTSASGVDPGWIEAGQGGRLAARYNTWNLTNCNQSEWVDIHGQQNWSGGSGGQTGTMVSEFYGNLCSPNCNGYRGINHRGGWGLYFNNISTGSGSLNHEINQYDTGDAGGSGCNSQMPNGGGGYNGQVNNTYGWNLLHNSVTKTLGTGSLGDGCGVTANNGYWAENAGCTSSACTAGIGKGTTPPTGTCTVGVGFWKATTATATIDKTVTQNGTFYKCTATNTWTVYYTPYTYPHPLIGGTPPVEPEPPPVTRFYLRFAELAFVIVGLGWKLRGPLLAGSLLLLQLGVTLRYAVPEYGQRTVYHGKVLAAHALRAVLPRSD